MAYDRAWLRSQLASYLHDNELGTLLDEFIDSGAQRIGQLLQSQYNEVSVQRQFNEATFPIEDEWKTIRNIEYQGNRGPATLVKSNQHKFNYYTQTGIPAVYRVSGNAIEVRPFTAGLFNVIYYGRVDIGSQATDTNNALQNYPFLFRSAALAEGYDYKQDYESADRYAQKWVGEATEINFTSAALRQGDAPAQEAI